MSNEIVIPQNTTSFSAATYLLEQLAKQGPVAVLLLGGLFGLHTIGNNHISTIDGMWKDRHTEQIKMVEGFQQTLEACCKDKRAEREQKANGIAGVNQ